MHFIVFCPRSGYHLHIVSCVGRNIMSGLLLYNFILRADFISNKVSDRTGVFSLNLLLEQWE